MQNLNKVIILHDVDGRIYFDAIQKLKDNGKIESIDFKETSVVKRLIRALIRRENIYNEIKKGINNFLFRLKLPFIKNYIIIFGIAPYDIRFIFYSILVLRNKVVYHTSWPYWWGRDVPRPNKPFTSINIFLFKKILGHKNFEYVGLTRPVSDSFSQGIKKNKVHKIHTIPHAVNLKLFKCECINNISSGKIKILYVGRMVKEKGIYEISELINRLDESKYSFSFIGTGLEENNLKEKLKSKNNVEFFGHLSDKVKLSNLFKQHNILLLPSKKVAGWEELFGMVVIEAMASGLLVIASNHIGPRGIISHLEDGILIDDNNLEDNMYDYILNYGDNAGNYMRKNALNIADRYSLDVISQEWLEVING